MKPETRAVVEEALRRIDNGQSVIPISPETKVPLISWTRYQRELPTPEEIMDWPTMFGHFDLGLVTGAISGVVVIDCDNEEAIEFAAKNGYASPYSVKTKRGRHFYFAHPGTPVQNAVGSSKPFLGTHRKIDIRGDGGYVRIPPTPGFSIEAYDDDLPLWRTPGAKAAEPSSGPDVYGEYEAAHFDLGSLDLSTVDERDASPVPIAERLRATGRKLGDGDGRNAALASHIGHLVKHGEVDEAALLLAADAFDAEFFTEPLSEKERQTTVRSILDGDRRRHPERHTGTRAPELKVTTTEAPPPTFNPEDLDALKDKVKEREYLIEPWLPKSSIVHLSGFTGHGKSLFASAALWSAAAGKPMGTFLVRRPIRVLYIDLELGEFDLVERFQDFRSWRGLPKTFRVYSPNLSKHYAGMGDIDLRTKEGIILLKRLMDANQPDVVVIDTTSAAWSGLEENSAEAWAPINDLVRRIRQAGPTAVLIHHSKRPDDTGGLRENGSLAQLRQVETQVLVTKLLGAPDIVDVELGKKTAKERAKAKAAIGDWSAWNVLATAAGGDFYLRTAVRVNYGKVRNETPNHQPVDVGFAYHLETGDLKVVTAPDLPKVRALEELRAIEKGGLFGAARPVEWSDIKGFAKREGLGAKLVESWWKNQ